MSGEATTDATTFDELLNGAGPGAGCRRCGEPATHRAQMTVRPRGTSAKGNGTPPAVANHKTDLCERCAVQLFAMVRKAMR
jgi:hypothetical protein